MEYNFDLFRDGRWEYTDLEMPIVHDFAFGTLGWKKVKFLTKILNNDMLTSFVYEPFLPNIQPQVSAGIVSQDGREVVVSVAGGDVDWDPLSYRIDWGDGTPISMGTGNIYEHTYPVGRYGDFIITATADDGRPEGKASKQMTITMEPPGAKAFDISEVVWSPVSANVDQFDGVGAFAVSNTGYVFAHNASSEIRRYAPTDALDGNAVAGTLVVGGVECCGNIAVNGDDEVYVAAPNGFYKFPNAATDTPDNGAMALSEESYVDVELSPSWVKETNDDRYILAVKADGRLERWSSTNQLVTETNEQPFGNALVTEIETCTGSGTMTAVLVKEPRANWSSVYINEDIETSSSNWVKASGKLSRLWHIRSLLMMIV